MLCDVASCSVGTRSAASWARRAENAPRAVGESYGSVTNQWVTTERSFRSMKHRMGSHDLAGRVRVVEVLSSVKRALDAGAAGIIAPRVSSAVVCEDIVRFAKFPPEGVRGIGVSRANQYGNKIDSYVSNANGGVSVVIQIEDKVGVDNLESILQVEGLDTVFVGPYDLSASIGRTGDLKHPEVQALIEYVRKKCMEVDKPVGIFEPDIEAARRRIEQGFSLITISTDISCIIHQTKTMLQSI